MSKIVFPNEIIERILYYCDGITLLNAELVSPEWKDIVEYLNNVKSKCLRGFITINVCFCRNMMCGMKD